MLKLVLLALATCAFLLFPPLFAQNADSVPDTTSAADSVITFNEIMYRPGKDDPAGEWIELYNQMSINMDISNWRLTGGIDFRFPTNTTFAANSYLVVAADPQAFKSVNRTANVFGPFTNSLSNGGENLRLRNNSGRLMDQIGYNDKEPWPIGADGSGASLAKRGRFNASSPAANWRASAQPGGTPGFENFPVVQASAPITDELINPNSTSRWFVPADPLDPNWPLTSFDDSAWTTAGTTLGYGGTALGDGPARAYLFEGDVKDASGHGFDGVNMGALFSAIVPPNHTGQSLQFNGLSNELRIPDAETPTAYTIAAWVAAETVRSSSIIVRTDPSGPKSSWSHQLRINAAGKFEHYTFDGGGHTIVATNTVVPGTWYHVVITAENNGKMQIYVNGVPSSDTQNVNTLWTGGDQWRLGTDSGGSTSFFRGRVDDLAIWKTVLSPGAIAQLAAGTPPLTVGESSEAPANDLKSALFGTQSSLLVRIPFVVPPGAAYDQLTLQARYADGFVAFLNGVEIQRRNAPQTLSWDAKATLARATNDSLITETFDVTPFAGNVRSGANVLAIQALRAAADSPFFVISAALNGRRLRTDAPPELAFSEIGAATNANFFVEIANSGASPAPLAGCTLVSATGKIHTFPATVLGAGELLAVKATDLGFTLGNEEKLFLLGPGQSLIDAAEVHIRARIRLRASPGQPWVYPVRETPGTPNEVSLHDEIVINEIMYHAPPAYRTKDTPFAENNEQWIELYNKSDHAVDLSGWKLDGEAEFELPFGTALARVSYLVIAGDSAVLRAKYPDISITGNFRGKLSHRAGRIVLVDNFGNPASHVNYFNSHPWPSYSNGGGSSLELREPRADSSVPESWGASLESDKSEWRHYSYKATAIRPVYTPNVGIFHEFRMGLLNEGEALVDNVTVTEAPSSAPRQLIQNPDFAAGTSKWRLLGNHSHTRMEGDTGALHLVATGPVSYLDNRLETTLKFNGTITPVVAGREYEIAFDAKWIAGSPQFRTELYYNKVAATTVLQYPDRAGTPGKPNSIYAGNTGPSYHNVKHAPAVPRSTDTITVTANANDPDTVSKIELFYSVNGAAWQTRTMLQSGDSYSADIPKQNSGAVIQFYLQGADALGAVSTWPANGRASRALIKVDTARSNTRQIVRTIMTSADSSLMHAATNWMSDDLLGCTLIHNEQEVFYDAQIRLHGSMFSRDDPSTTGMTIKLPANHLFRGSRESIIVRRRGMVETYAKHMLNAAGGLPGNYDDIVYLVSHRNDNIGNARLNLANYDDTYVDSQFEGDNNGTVFKLEGIREYQTTANGTAEGYKLSQPIGWIQSFDIANLGNDQEQYRWGIMIQSRRDLDDYSRIMAMGKAFSLTGTALQNAIPQAIDIDEWARLFAMQTLMGIADVYGIENPHNFAFYVRPSDQRVVGLQNDWEFVFGVGPTASIYGAENIYKVLRLAPFKRLYQKHLLDIINNVGTSAYASAWASHISKITGESYSTTYVSTRANSIRGQLMPRIPFEITSNTGGDFQVDTSEVTLEGRGWIDVHTIRQAGALSPLNVNWLDDQRWRISVPLKPGSNTVALQAYSWRGDLVGEDSILITTTATEFPQRDYLKITELMYHPGAPSAAEATAGFTDSDEFEYVEVANTGPVPASLIGVRFDAGITYDFSSGIVTNLLPSQRVLVVKSRPAFTARYGGNLLVTGEYAGSLSNSGELIRMIDASGATIEEFGYSDAGSWPTMADGGGSSLERVDPTASPAEPSSWQASVTGGTPGSAPASLPRISSFTFDGTSLTLRFDTANATTYTIYYSTDLKSWSVLKELTANEFTEPAGESKRFYRISVP
jgi:hypothetical protein